MEAEKIKTLEAKLEHYRLISKGLFEYCINNGIGTPHQIVYDAIVDHIKTLEAKILKQPSVSVMPSDEEIEKEATKRINYLSKKSGWRGFIEGAKWLKEALSLSKEAPKERIPDVGETIKETAIEFHKWAIKNDWFLDVTDNTYHQPGNAKVKFEVVFDLFKQRNK